MSTQERYLSIVKESHRLLSLDQPSPSLLESVHLLFEDIQAFLYYRGKDDIVDKMEWIEVEVDLTLEKPFTFHLEHNGLLKITTNPKKYQGKSLKEVLFLFLSELAVFDDYDFSKLQQAVKDPDVKEDALDALLSGMSKEISSLFGQIPTENPYRDYQNLSQQEGDLFDLASQRFDPKQKNTSSIPLKLALEKLANDAFHQQEEDGEPQEMMMERSCSLFGPDDELSEQFDFGSIEENPDGSLDQEAMDSFFEHHPKMRRMNSGSTSNDVRSGVAKRSKPAWVKLLNRYAYQMSEEKKKTKTRLNRRQPNRFDLSGSLHTNKAKIVCAIDVSGSMNKEEIDQALGQILVLKERYGFSLALLFCDCEIKGVKEIRKKSDIPKKFKGGGWTLFSPVIDYVNQHREYKDTVLIYFTDGGGENKIPKPQCRALIWVITGGSLRGEPRLSVSPSYGYKVAIEGGKIYQDETKKGNA